MSVHSSLISQLVTYNKILSRLIFAIRLWSLETNWSAERIFPHLKSVIRKCKVCIIVATWNALDKQKSLGNNFLGRNPRLACLWVFNLQKVLDSSKRNSRHIQWLSVIVLVFSWHISWICLAAKHIIFTFVHGRVSQRSNCLARQFLPWLLIHILTTWVVSPFLLLIVHNQS